MTFKKETAIQHIKEKRKYSFYPFIIFNSAINNIEKEIPKNITI